MGKSKHERLLFILNLLRSRKNLNAAMLAEECGVTERSIYRDIVALSEANIPIYYDNGYKLASDNFLPPLNFDLAEFMALREAVWSTPLRRVAKYGDLLKSAWTKIEARASDQVRKDSRFTPRTTQVHVITTLERRRCARFYGLIEEAATTYRCLRLKYGAVSSGPTERLVEPYFIVFRGHAFYFVAFCRLRGEFRTFRLDRIEKVELTDQHFDKHSDITAESYFDASWEVYSGPLVEVKVRFSGPAARVITSGCHHRDEEIEVVSDDEVVYKATTRGTEEIGRWILGFGSSAEVLEPPELKQRLAEIGAYLSATYGKTM